MMTIRSLAFACFSLAGVGALSEGADVSLTLTVRNPHVIFGEPLAVVIAVRNDAPKTLRLSFLPAGDVLGGGVPRVFLIAQDGARGECGALNFSRTADFAWKMDDDGAVTTPAGKTIRVLQELAFPAAFVRTPGQYELQAIYEGHGKQLIQVQPPPGTPPAYCCDGCWKGEVSSEIRTITLSAPEGFDREAYEYFKGQPLSDPMRAGELLQKFPASRYAAYVILKYAGPPTFEPSDEKALSYLAGALRTGSLLTNSYPDDTGTGHNGWKSLQGEAAASWIDKWCETILTNHPDIWFADDLRLKKAVDEVALKNFQQGESLLNALAANPKSTVREKASACLRVMRKQGWIK